jgi:hypothetical protein
MAIRHTGGLMKKAALILILLAPVLYSAGRDFPFEESVLVEKVDKLSAQAPQAAQSWPPDTNLTVIGEWPFAGSHTLAVDTTRALSFVS